MEVIFTMSNKGSEYTARRDYVAGLNLALSAVPDFERIVYVHTNLDKEYVKIWNTIGWVVYLDVSQKSLYDIFNSVALSVRGQEPDNILTDIDTIRSIVPLIRQEVRRQLSEEYDKLNEGL